MDRDRIVGQLVKRCKRFIENVFKVADLYAVASEAAQQQAVDKYPLEQQARAGCGPAGAALPDEAQGAPGLGRYEAAERPEPAVALALAFECVEMQTTPQASNKGTANDLQIEENGSQTLCRGSATPEGSAHGGEGDGTNYAFREVASYRRARRSPAARSLDSDDGAENPVTPHGWIGSKTVIATGEQVVLGRASACPIHDAMYHVAVVCQIEHDVTRLAGLWPEQLNPETGTAGDSWLHAGPTDSALEAWLALAEVGGQWQQKGGVV